MRRITTFCCTAALAALLMPAAYAQDNEAAGKKLTEITFSAPIQVPGVTLPAGTYTFQTAETGDHVVQIFDKERSHIFATILTVPNDRLEPTDKTVVMFSERPADVPPAVKMWYYPGNPVGEEFIYPKAQAMAIAKAYDTSVLASDDEKIAKGGRTTRVGENATGFASNEAPRANNADSTGAVATSGTTTAAPDSAVATSGTIETTPDPSASSAGRSNSFAPQSNSSAPESHAISSAPLSSSTPQNNSFAPQSSNAFASSGATATTGVQQDPAASAPSSRPTPRAARRSLPRTASDLSGLELLSALSIAAAFTLMGVRKYQAAKHTA